MVELLLRLNLTREISWIQEFNADFSSIMISANVFESFPKAFISALGRIKKPFIIDPVTHILAIDTLDFSDKRWYAKLIGNYGLDVILSQDSTIITIEHLLTRNRQPKDALKALVDNVITYQRIRIINAPELEEIVEIADFEGMKIDIDALVPRWIIPPYFLIGSDDWLVVNIECIKEAIHGKKSNEKIYAVISIDTNILAFKEEMDKIIAAYNIKGIDGYLVWVSDFRENLLSQPELSSFVQFIEKLAKFGKPIYNMYGGLFSLMLNKKGISGVCHSICYGESKDPFAEGGMMATIRYYDEELKIKIPYGRLQDILKFTKRKMCDCEGCRELDKIRGDMGSQLKFTAQHFLLKRSNEIQEINSQGTTNMLARMESAHYKYSNLDTVGTFRQFYTHLAYWIGILQ